MTETTLEMMAMALDPALWSDDEQVSHMAASPLRLDVARRFSLDHAKRVIERLNALRNGGSGHV